MSRRLEDLEPYLVSANVRPRFTTAGVVVSDGTGQVGDLVLGEVLPAPGQTITVFDLDLTAHSVSSPTRVVAVLGTRLSSVHVNAGIPAGGLEVFTGSEAHWIAGESGMVGRLFFEADAGNPLGAETSVGFRCEGLLSDSSGTKINLQSLAVTPTSTELTTPILFVAATAAEAGKTVLAAKVIRYLVGKGTRVAAVKVTGTGGTMDSQEHGEAGAFLTVDQVDAGLITTYCSPETFRERISRSFLFAQDHEPDLIVAELGGDLTFANNPTVFQIPDLRENLSGMIVISNDPLSCYGVSIYLGRELGVPPGLVRHFSSPFRNPAGMKARASVMGVEEVFDPNDQAEIEAVVDSLVSASMKTF
jgi:hypothetical protein